MLQSLILLASLALDPTITLIDSGKPDANRKALESAIAAANQGPGVRPIVVPHGFTVDRPVLAFGGNLEIRGDRPRSSFRCVASSPPLVLLNPSPGFQDGAGPAGPRRWTGDHVIEAKGRGIDSSLAPSAGKWTGLSTFAPDGTPDTVYAFPNSPFTNPYGKSWGAVRSFTFDVSYDVGSGAGLGFQVCGAAVGPEARPFYLRTAEVAGKAVHEVHFRTDDRTDRWFRVPIPEASGLRRLSFAIDLDSATVTAWASGRSATIDGRGLGDDFLPGSGLSLVDSDLCCFKLGGLGLDPCGWQDSFGGPARYTFFGCRATLGNPYASADDGRQIVAYSGKPATDADRYGYGDVQKLIGFVDFSQPIRDARLVRWIASKPNGTPGFGLALLGGYHTHPYNTGTRVRLVDLDMQGGSAEDTTLWPYGAGIWCGGTLQGFSFERCRFAGGLDGFGGLMAGACYPVLFRDCTFRGGTGNGFTSRMMTAHFDGLTTVEYPARNGILAVMSSLDIPHLFMSEAGPEALTNITMRAGGKLRLSDCMLDTENTPSPRTAIILMERGVNGEAPGTRLEVANSVIDGGGPGTPLILLRDMSKEPLQPGTVEVRGLMSWHADRGPTVQTDGPMWTGRVLDFMGNRPAWRVHDPRWGEAGKIEGVE